MDTEVNRHIANISKAFGALRCAVFTDQNLPPTPSGRCTRCVSCLSYCMGLDAGYHSAGTSSNSMPSKIKPWNKCNILKISHYTYACNSISYKSYNYKCTLKWCGRSFKCAPTFYYPSICPLPQIALEYPEVVSQPQMEVSYTFLPSLSPSPCLPPCCKDQWSTGMQACISINF